MALGRRKCTSVSSIAARGTYLCQALPDCPACDADPRICAVTREYTVESGPEYTASYFTSFGDVVRDDGTDLPWGLRPEAGCAVKWPETKCRLKFYQTPNISVAVSQRDIWSNVSTQRPAPHS